MKAPTHKWRHALWLAIFLFSLLFQGQTANAQWWKDTVWTKETDQMFGFYMLKFSKNDSIIVGHGYGVELADTVSLFFDAKTGNEIKRINGTNEIFFINNDRNFVRLREDNSKFEIFDAKTYTVLDSIENDELHINQYPIIDMSKDEKYLVAGIPNGFRIWDIQTKRIFKTKIYPNEPNLKSVGIDNPRFICGTNNVMVQLSKIYYDPNIPNKEIHYGNFVGYDNNTLDSIDSYGNHSSFVLSNTCKYIAYGTGDMYNGVEVYDFNTKELLWKIPVNSLTLTGLEFSPDDKYLVTASSNINSGMKIWEMATLKLFYDYDVENTYSNMNVSHNSKFIAYSIGRYLGVFKAHFNGVSVNEPFKSEKSLFPNPTNDSITLNFELTTQKQLNYSIYNETGQTIKLLLDEFSNSGKIIKTFDISDLPSATYFLGITGENFSLTYKVVIAR